MDFRNVHVQEVSCCKYFTAIFARVRESARKVDVLNMFSQVGFVITDFPTNNALECLWPSFWMADNVIVKLLVSTFVSISINQCAFVAAISAVLSVVLVPFLVVAHSVVHLL